MFKKILIANRGEIAVRIIHTCREMGIPTVALYEQHDRGSLHVRLADESVQLKSDHGFNDIDAILTIARDKQADAIHPGYGFLAERQAFVDACRSADITFIGPMFADGADVMVSKRDTLQRVSDAGFQTVQFSEATFAIDEMDALRLSAEAMGYPLVIKSISGGRGAGERLVRQAESLEEAVRRAQVESQTIYGSHRVYLERAVLPAHQIGVEVLADAHGHIVHLGEHEGSIIYGNRKVVEESPSPNLAHSQRTALHQTAIELVRQFRYQGGVTVEFLADDSGNFYFTEFKNRIQTNHPVIEEVTSVDLVRQQIRLAAGEALDLRQEDVQINGWAMMCRINAEAPSMRFLPSPGTITHARFPGGPGVRVDTYVYDGCIVPAEYSRLFAKVTAWGPDRPTCLARIRRAIADTALSGPHTNIPYLMQILGNTAFEAGSYDTRFLAHHMESEASDPAVLRDLAVAAAIQFARRNLAFNPTLPERMQSGWHRSSRRLPE